MQRTNWKPGSVDVGLPDYPVTPDYPILLPAWRCCCITLEQRVWVVWHEVHGDARDACGAP